LASWDISGPGITINSGSLAILGLEPVVDLGVEGHDALPVGGDLVGVGVRASFDQSVQFQPGEVVAHLVRGVSDAEEMAHLGTKAPVGDAEGIEGEIHRAPSRAMTRGAPNLKAGALFPSSERGDCDPLKGWARKDTTLPDTFSIEHSAVYRTTFGLQLGQVR